MSGIKRILKYSDSSCTTKDKNSKHMTTLIREEMPKPRN